MILRAAAAGLCCVALFTGCGGDDDGDKAGYERALNTFCSAMEKGTAKVQADSAKLQSGGSRDPRQLVKGIGGVLGTFATTMERAVTKLRDVDVPGDYERFNTDVVNGVNDLVGKLREAAKQARAGDVRGVQALSSSLKGELPGLPTDLAKKAPACGRIS
ncbi:MAG TPA: hypothetical protein VFZ89_11840 [Solirubrobacteraceae bacterium]